MLVNATSIPGSAFGQKQKSWLMNREPLFCQATGRTGSVAFSLYEASWTACFGSVTALPEGPDRLNRPEERTLPNALVQGPRVSAVRCNRLLATRAGGKRQTYW